MLQGVSEGILLQKNRADETISTLGADIERFKEEYATAIRDIDSIKMEMDSVHSKVCRAEHLLSSLSNEEERWKERESKFDSHLKTLAGDSLLAAAFVTYGPMFDYQTRIRLKRDWDEIALNLGLPHRPLLIENDLLIGYLSKAAQRLEWQTSFELPTDSLSVSEKVYAF